MIYRPCSICKQVFHIYWLKHDKCNGCNNPSAIVPSIRICKHCGVELYSYEVCPCERDEEPYDTYQEPDYGSEFK